MMWLSINFLMLLEVFFPEQIVLLFEPLHNLRKAQYAKLFKEWI